MVWRRDQGEGRWKAARGKRKGSRKDKSKMAPVVERKGKDGSEGSGRRKTAGMEEARRRRSGSRRGRPPKQRHPSAAGSRGRERGPPPPSRNTVRHPPDTRSPLPAISSQFQPISVQVGGRRVGSTRAGGMTA